jgi:arylsulfatase A-like enzyme
MSTAERWLEQHYKEKFFLYVDTWDPHEPWDPPAHYVEQYYEGYGGQPIPHPCYWEWREAGLTEDDLELAHASYCGEVTMVDRWVGRLLERIESLDLLEKTVIVFTSDHGFYFGEHGLFGKGRLRGDKGFFAGTGRPAADGWVRNLLRSPETGELAYGDHEWYRCPIYDEVARIPLMIYAPGAQAGRSKALVTLPDVMPTVLDLADVAIPDGVQAASLAPLLAGGDKTVHDILVTSWPLKNPGEYSRVVDDIQRRLRELSPSTVTADEWTLIYSVAGEQVELYHTASDPQQEKNVVADNKDVAEQLHRRFVHFLASVGTDERLMATRQTLV